MSFKTGDIVQVVKGHWKRGGKIGVVSSVSGAVEDGYYHVAIDDTMNVISGKDLTPYDAKREALIELAETLDRARHQANAIEETAPQSGVYGHAATALVDTLGLILSPEGNYIHRYEVYDAILDGNTVREALKVVGV